jgi:tetratricopeptide (TPR) repeat protein
VRGIHRIHWNLLSALLLAAPATAWAQAAPVAQPGAELLETGKAAYSDGRYKEALRAFQQSYELSHKPKTLYRVGDTADKLGLHARAVAALSQYLELVPTAPDRPFIQSRIDANRRATAAPAADAALSPVAAARAEPPPPSAAEPAASPPEVAPALDVTASPAATSKDLTRAWWLWAGAGTLVVAGIVVLALTVGSSSSHSTPDPVKGNVGGAVQTLGGS